MKSESGEKHGWTKDWRPTVAFITHRLKSYSQLDHVSLLEVSLAPYSPTWAAKICIATYRKGTLTNMVRIFHRPSCHLLPEKAELRIFERFLHSRTNKFQRTVQQMWDLTFSRGWLGWDALYSGRSLQTFRRNVLIPSSGSKNKPNKGEVLTTVTMKSPMFILLHKTI
jgi:hypothetical protein